MKSLNGMKSKVQTQAPTQIENSIFHTLVISLNGMKIEKVQEKMKKVNISSPSRDESN